MQADTVSLYSRGSDSSRRERYVTRKSWGASWFPRQIWNLSFYLGHEYLLQSVLINQISTGFYFQKLALYVDVQMEAGD